MFAVLTWLNNKVNSRLTLVTEICSLFFRHAATFDAVLSFATLVRTGRRKTLLPKTRVSEISATQ